VDGTRPDAGLGRWCAGATVGRELPALALLAPRPRAPAHPEGGRTGLPAVAGTCGKLYSPAPRARTPALDP